MGRAQGKNPQRGGDWIGRLLDDLKGGEPGPSEGEERQAGAGEQSPHGAYAGDPRDIPGGRPHIGNPPVKKYAPSVPDHEDPFRNAILAHGVLPDGQHYDRDPRLSGGQRDGKPPYHEVKPDQHPVPVYIVENASKPGMVRMAAPRSVTCPASTNAEPIRVASLNPRRIKIGLLNEDTATDIRFATGLSELAAGTGALLPWPNNNYVWFETQGEIWAIGATGSGTPKISIIEVSLEVAAA